MGCASKRRQPRHTWVQVDKCLRSGSIQTWLASVAFLVALMALLPVAFVGWVAFETGLASGILSDHSENRAISKATLVLRLAH